MFFGQSESHSEQDYLSQGMSQPNNVVEETKEN
jgi:hypothetical protein